MKILVAVDMEGISGVTSWEHVTPGHAEYLRFRKLMTQDVNAAITGAFESGATEILVADGHWNSGNILVEELHPRAQLSSGTPAPLSMVSGIDSSVDAVFFIGYHARAGSQAAILDHTWSSKTIHNLWLNGVLVGEVGLNAAVCGHYSVPVVLVTGDHTVASEAQELLGPLETVAVKVASGRYAAACLAPEVARERIREAAHRALRGLKEKTAPPPYKLQSPIQVRVEFHSSDMADLAVLVPGVTRLDGRMVTLTAPDMLAAYNGFRSVVLASRE